MPNEPAAEKLSIEFTPEFKRNIRHLSKKYRHIKSDINFIIKKLKAEETPGNRIPAIGFIVYKLRVKNSDIPRSTLSITLPDGRHGILPRSILLNDNYDVIPTILV